MPQPFRSPTELANALGSVGYLADEPLSMAAFLALGLDRPLLLEGANGVACEL